MTRLVVTSLMFLFLMALGAPLSAEVDPDLPVEPIPYPMTNQVDPLVEVQVVYDPAVDDFAFTYVVTSGPGSLLPFCAFDLGPMAEPYARLAPPLWSHGFVREEDTFGVWQAPTELMSFTADVEAFLAPGESVTVGFRSRGLPAVGMSYSEGDIPPPSGQQVVLPPPEDYDGTWEAGTAQVKTVIPIPRPEPLELPEVIAHLRQDLVEAQTLGWATSIGQLDTALAQGQSHLANGADQAAIASVRAALEYVEAERGGTLDDNAYFLSKPNLEFVLNKLGALPTILPASKDSFLRQRDSHVNEGANPDLALMKITGKPARPVVGFDLSKVDTNAVSRATLVLTIDPADSPTGWGSGRTISVRRLLESWTEGNGVSGPGVTWFTPVDSDVGNNGPDGPLQWAGGDLASDNPTAAPATITNHLTGEVSFDVTWDVLNGADHGWLVVRDNEKVGSKVRFYSREGAGSAGNPDLAPRLHLEFGNTGRAGDSRLLARATRLLASEPRDIELGGKLSSGTTAVVVEELAVLATRPLLFAELPTRLIYRLWSSAALSV